ncbi:MAG TPA: DUF3443 domain-containing protein [Vicinamibacteria bacterium]|nr:DUF3443 domain-containing protein [Vicinamibacteria bacterium]
MSAGRGLAVAGLLLLVCCGGGSSNGTTSTSIDNTLPVTVTSGPANNTVNGLYASVTICVPGSSNCQTIDNVQVDTGSMGLRLISSLVTLSLPAVNDAGGRPVGNCATYADQSYTWGPVVTADIQLAGEKAASVPIQLIGASNFAGAPPECSNGGTAEQTPDALAANGLLGVGVFRQDCGPACSGGGSPPPVYFSCPGLCTAAFVPVQSQLQNPVWMFPQDNNGLLLSLPAVPATGAPTASGSVIFGIGTQGNNALGSAQVYTTDATGNFSTNFQGNVYSSSFLDTGSNGLYFLDASTIGLPACADPNSGYACPSSTVSYTATNTGANGTAAQVNFSIASAESLFRTNNNAFSNLGGPDTGEFDWGLPFFFGRNTFVGIENQSTTAGPGPYWAY